jgi:poly(3-hydroxybutyrate) depolymerase
MRNIPLWILVSVLASACGSSEPVASRFGEAAPTGMSVPPQPATGEGCAGIYGNPPMSIDPSLQGQAADAWPIEEACPLRGAELLTWEDADGTPRRACLHAPAQATPQHRLPLLVYLGGSLFPGDPQTPYNSLEFLTADADLTGDPDRAGFTLLMVEGRDKAHHYPFPDDTAWGFDHWYRNLNRADPAMNVDVATIDYFIGQVLDRGIVDTRRIYFAGWSNGASMAILYTLNTPGVAAAAVYSSPEPFSDLFDPCWQPPFGNNLRPIMTVHNHCDIAGICQTGSEGFRKKIMETMPSLNYRPIIIDELQEEVAACDAACAYSGDPMDLLNAGSPRHLMWPYLWNEEFFGFLREHPLP